MIQDEFKKLKDEWSSKIMLKQGEPVAELFLRKLAVVEAIVEDELKKSAREIASLKEENEIIRNLIGADEAHIKAKILSQSEEIRFLQGQLLEMKNQIAKKDSEHEKKLLEVETLKRELAISEDVHSKERLRLQKTIEDVEGRLRALDKSWNEKYEQTRKELADQRRSYQNRLNSASVDIWRFSYSVFSGWIEHLRDQMGAIFGATDYIHSQVSESSSVRKLRKAVEPDLILVKEKTAAAVETFNRMADFFSVQPELVPGDINSVIKRLKETYLKTGVAIIWPEEKEYPKIVMDENLLAEAFAEVIKNAIEAIGPAERSGRIIFAMDCDDVNFKFDISDSGPGVTEENQEKLFTPFFTTKHRHAGLGLVRAKRNILFHSGEIFYAPKDGMTNIRIRLSHE